MPQAASPFCLLSISAVGSRSAKILRTAAFSMPYYSNMCLRLYNIDEEQIEQYIDDVEGGHEIMTIVENLVMRGERLGIRKGERLGIDKGRTEGKAEVAQRMLRMDFNSDVVHKATGLSASEIETLRHSLNGS